MRELSSPNKKRAGQALVRPSVSLGTALFTTVLVGKRLARPPVQPITPKPSQAGLLAQEPPVGLKVNPVEPSGATIEEKVSLYRHELSAKQVS